MNPVSQTLKNLRLLPIAITRSGESEGCVGALTDSGEWIRPQPILARELESHESPFRYHHWTNVTVRLPVTEDARPEDRNLVGTPLVSVPLGEDEWFKRLSDACDRNVKIAFEGNRSLGLIQIQLKDIYIKRYPGNRKFIRLCFTDNLGDLYDWIIPEIAFGVIVWHYVEETTISQSFVTRFLKVLSQIQVFAAIGLTLPNNRYPGKFRGCHPLVVGLHTIPDYSTFQEFQPELNNS